ncbi:MAG: hypothetical protein AB8B72_12360 [Crocinitomicaceae bacterium]
MTARVLFYLTLLTLVTALALWKYRKLSKAFKYLALLLVITLMSEITAKVLEVKIGSSFSVYHFLIVGGMILNFFIYLNILVLKKLSFLMVLGLTVVLIILTVYNSVYIQPSYQFPSNGIMLHCFQTIFLALLLFLNMLKFPVKTALFKQPAFWLNTGNLVFYGVTFSVFAFYNFFYQSVGGNSAGFNLVYLANILLYSSYAYAILLNSNVKNG